MMSTMKKRIVGIDVARAIAIIGMVMAHIGPLGVTDDSAAAIAYRSVHGRSAILFGLLAGVGVSLFHGRSRGRVSTTQAMVWRAVVLFPIGVWLQSLDTPVAVILQYYAFFFLAAAVAVHLPDRMLIAGAVFSALVGPLMVLGLAAAGVSRPPVPEWYQVDRTLFMVLIAGYYPLVTWMAPLLTGLWIGRRDLRSDTFSLRLVGGGLAALAVGYIVSVMLIGVVGDPATSMDVRRLAVIEPHNQMPLWLLTATGAACAVLGSSLFVARRVPQLMEPLVAMGRLAFTIYVAHLVVFEVDPERLVPNETYADAWARIGWFVVVVAIASVVYRRLVGTGPFEYLLRAPWAITRRRSASETRAAA